MYRETAISYLSQNELQNVVFLKLIEQLKDRLKIVVEDSSVGYAILLVVPRGVSDFYTGLYPEVDQVLFPVATDLSLLQQLLDSYQNTPLMIAITQPPILNTVRKKFQLAYQRSYLSYTTDKFSQSSEHSGEVVVNDHFSPEIRALIIQNGFSERELQRIIDGGAIAFYVCDLQGKVISVCCVYQNYHDIWEIGGLRTIPEHRGKGLAKTLVQAAANYLLEHGRTVRYQAEDSNKASMNLVKSLGFTKFLEIQHFLTTARKDRNSQEPY